MRDKINVPAMSRKLEQLRDAAENGIKRGWITLAKPVDGLNRQAIELPERKRPLLKPIKCPECERTVDVSMTPKGIVWRPHKMSEAPYARWCGNGGELVG